MSNEEKQYVTGYYRVGTKAQLGKKLNNIHAEIVAEEQNMKDLAAQFMESSEKYNKLRATQRTLIAQLFTVKTDREAAKKRG